MKQTILYFKVFRIGSWHFSCAITLEWNPQMKRTEREHCVRCALPSCIFGFISRGTNRYHGYFSLKCGSFISAWWSSVVDAAHIKILSHVLRSLCWNTHQPRTLRNWIFVDAEIKPEVIKLWKHLVNEENRRHLVHKLHETVYYSLIMKWKCNKHLTDPVDRTFNFVVDQDRSAQLWLCILQGSTPLQSHLFCY